jgi:hypothetical protein
MKPRALTERAQRVLDKLSERIDQQAMRAGADAPHVVAIVGAFHSYAGRFEQRLEGLPMLTVSDCAAELHVLLRSVRTHALLVAQRALVLRMAKR